LITLTPIPRALLPVDSTAAAQLSAPNYDEFQGDQEVWEVIRANPESALRVTMAHCDVDAPTLIGVADSEESRARAAANMAELISSDLTREIQNALWVYEIEDPKPQGIRQIGLGGMARTDEIRTEATPGGSIIRNEGIREPKARGRADLIRATGAIIGTVNNAIDDAAGRIQEALEAHARGVPADLEVDDHAGYRHRVWIVAEETAVRRFQDLLAEEPHAYVADGNHRSAAAAMLGYEHFLAVFFPARSMGIDPYNRLVREAADNPSVDGLMTALKARFAFEDTPTPGAYQPSETHRIGFYAPERGWMSLQPLPGTFDPEDASGAIDADIVQKNLFEQVFGISDPGDERLTFVGGNKDAAWLQSEVDEGRAAYAGTLPPVTMAQFSEVCRQSRHMPPKSTWFVPKIRSGLVMALLD
jgi:uncharacterized protein (DUF1015 family)